ILTACQRSLEQQIVIVHGTDTMAQTGQMLQQAAMPKTIVLTGAMVPYAIRESDALFNLGFAIAVAQCQPEGVYIAMNARVWPAHQVIKNKKLGIFESV
ncbi:MAG TPA: asparaginase domain-containing protein, partial [Gemmatales bacterium]|nr:asparaginase domain-containing protein [Gemmatales bacterium]